MSITYDSPASLLALLGALLLAYFLGHQLSRRFLGVPTLETVLLVWVGLFLGLTLQQVSQNYRQRAELVYQESDSIAHVYRVLQSLPNAQRTQMRLLLIAYLDAKLAGAKAQEIVGLQDQQFKLSCDMTKERVVSELQGVELRGAIDRMISMHYRCLYTLDEHLPGPVVFLLLAQCVAAALLMGLGARQPLLSITVITLMLLSVATIIDLDDASHGMVRVDNANLRDLVNSMHRQEQL